jgi:hypothetical protein
MRVNKRPKNYWHCYIQLGGKNPNWSVANDLTFDQLQRQIIEPWHQQKKFAVGGLVIPNSSQVTEVKIVHTRRSQKQAEAECEAENQANNIIDCVTDLRRLPFDEGKEFTHDLLYEDQKMKPQISDADVSKIVQVCARLRHSAQSLSDRKRKKPNFVIVDEYDVQDLLYAVLRAYLKQVISEEPLGKVANTTSGRADLAIQKFGVLIEVKLARNARDRRRILDDFRKDLDLFAKWPHLKHLIYFIYNSNILADAEALEELDGTREISGRRFNVKVVLG